MPNPSLSYVPLSDLHVLSAFHGHSNRITRGKIVREIGDHFDEKLLQPLIGYKEKGIIHVIDGQHRHAGLLRRGVAMRVPIFIYDATHLETGESVTDFITRIRKGVHTRAAQTGIDELSAGASLSPWYQALLAANLEVSFQNPHKLNVPNILRARLAVDDLQARIAKGETPDAAFLAVTFNRNVNALITPWTQYDRAKVQRTIAILNRWTTLVADPASAAGYKGYHKALALAFPILIEEEPGVAPALVADMYKRIGNNLSAPRSQNPIEVLGELLYRVNHKRATHNRVNLLGRNLWGSQTWKKV